MEGFWIKHSAQGKQNRSSNHGLHFEHQCESSLATPIDDTHLNQFWSYSSKRLSLLLRWCLLLVDYGSCTESS